MSKYFYIIDLHFGAMQPCSSGLGMTLEASDFRSVRRLVAYSMEAWKGTASSLEFGVWRLEFDTWRRYRAWRRQVTYARAICS